MSKVSVVYWSQSGNTQAMAEAVAAGITEAGKEAEVVYVSDVNVADLTAEKAFALGCPATVSYTHLRAHETDSYLVCRLLLEKKDVDNQQSCR